MKGAMIQKITIFQLKNGSQSSRLTVDNHRLLKIQAYLQRLEFKGDSFLNL